MESKFSKLQVDVLKAALQGEGKAVKSPVNAEFKAALSVELESIARAQASVEDSGVSVGLERLSNGKNMPPIASGFISQKPSYSLDTVLPDISTREFDVYALGPKVPESRFVLRSQELAAPSLYLSEIVSNKKGSNAVLHDANGGRGRLEDKDLSLISRLGVLPGQKQLESVRKEVVSVHSQATEIFMPVDSDSSSGRKQEQARYADDAVRGAGSVANRVSPEAQTPPSVTQQSLASADDAVRGAGSVANRVSPEAQTPPSVTQQSLASADDAVRGAGSVANRVSPEAQTPPSVTQQSLASADDAVRGAGSVANRVSPEAQTPPSVTQQSLASADDAVRGAGSVANRVSPEAQTPPSVTQQSLASADDAVRGAGSVANRVSPEAQTPPSVTQQSLASADDAVRGAGSVANRVSPEAQTPPSVTQQSLASADDAVRGAGSVANRVSPEAQTPPSVTQQSLASADDAVRGAGSVANRVSPEAQTPPSVTQQSLASADDAVRGAGSVANRVSPEAQTPPSVTQQSLASADDAVRGAGSVANRVSPEAQTPPSVTQQSLASADDAVRGAGSVANRVSPEAQTPPSVTQQSLASADDAVRGAGSVANRVSPEAQTPPSVTQQSLASADDAVRGAGSVANRVSPEAQTPPSVTQQSLVAAQESVSRFEPGVSRNVASSAAAEFSMSNRLVRSDEAKNKATGKDIDQSVDAKLVRSDAELSRREAHKQTSGEFVNRAEPPQINMIRGVELKDTHFPQRSGERLMDYLPVAENVSSSKAADGKAISGEFVQYLETRVSNGISVDRSNFDSKVMVSNPTDRASISAGGGGAALAAAVGKQLIDRISAGTERVRLVLHPKELGVVDVTMDVKNGKVDAILASANPVTREMLGDNLGRLRESLMQAGFDSGDVEVSDRPASDGSSDRNGDVPTAMQVADNDGAINSGVEVTEIEIVLDPDEINFLV